MKKIMLLGLFFTTFIFTLAEKYDPKPLYTEMKLDKKINYKTFEEAIKGYNKTKKKKNDTVVIIDYNKSSKNKRFYVLDLKKKEIVFNTHVAHGERSGKLFAKQFSNTLNSRQSSLGLYKTGETYYGKHGYSLKLDGLERGYNDNARARAIVIHGASYADASYIKRKGMLGNSWGCPALPKNMSKKVIDKIKNGAIMYVAGNKASYKNKAAKVKVPKSEPSYNDISKTLPNIIFNT